MRKEFEIDGRDEAPPETTGIADLHVHSTASDGSTPPEELIAVARKSGVSAVALTDHNTLAGLARFEAAARGTEIVAIPGVEVTAGATVADGEREVHILGLFIPRAVRDELAVFLSEIDRRKRAANCALIERLAAAGYAIDLASVLLVAGEATPNRVHIANVLMERGYVGSVKEAFDTLLRDGGGFYRAPERLNALEVIRFLRSHGILPVLAHPLLTLSQGEVCAFLPQAREAGLVGVETVYPLYSPEEADFMAEVAERFGLLPSGGSDYHGTNKPDIDMGRGRGNIVVPFVFYEGLKALSDQNKRGNTMKHIIVEGHRGWAAKYPENTLISFEAAIRLGVDAFEFDVWLTSDKVPVLMHDGNALRTCGVDRHVRDMTLAEVKALDACYEARFGDTYKGQGVTVPTLEETLQLAESLNPAILYGVEIKEYTEENVDLTVALLKQYGVFEKCWFYAFNGRIIRYLKEKYNARTMGYPDVQMKEFSEGDFAFYDELGLSMTYVRSELCAFYREKGMPIHMYCADTEEDVRLCIERGASLITANDPVPLLSIVRGTTHPRSTVQMAELTVRDGRLCCDRNAEFDVDWSRKPITPQATPATERPELTGTVHPLNSFDTYKYVVVCTFLDGKVVLSRHKERTTWETQGGHIEPGETPLEAARRELYEESGIRDAEIIPICDYCGYRGTRFSYGVFFVAKASAPGVLPASEIAEVRIFDALPEAENLTYPLMTPLLYEEARKMML